MPIEDITVPKAPKGWRPTSDQMKQIGNDSRLQRLSVDDLYFYFNQPKRNSGVTVERGSTTNPAPSKVPPAQSGGIFGWVDSVRKALGGG